jgi:hypothetical protein
MPALAEHLTTLDQEVARLREHIPLAQAAAELPRRRRGKKTHVASLYRWTTTGCRGVKLRYVQVGATRCTTREWLADFFERLTAASTGAATPQAESTPPLSSRMLSARARAVAQAERELEKLGI